MYTVRFYLAFKLKSTVISVPYYYQTHDFAFEKFAKDEDT